MAKVKKLTVKIYENRQLKEYSMHSHENETHTFYPLYLMITFNRKVKTIKSPTCEFLERTNSAFHLLPSNWGKIQNNDERLMNHFRKYVEEGGKEFDVLYISPENQDYKKFKIPIFDVFSKEFTAALSGFFLNLSQEKESEFSTTQLILHTYPNSVHFLRMMQELNRELALDFISLNPLLIKMNKMFFKLQVDGIFPFYADYLANEDFLEELSKLRSLSKIEVS